MWIWPTVLRLWRRQLSRKAPELGQECRPHEHTIRPLGFSVTVQGLPSWSLQNGHMPGILSEHVTLDQDAAMIHRDITATVGRTPIVELGRFAAGLPGRLLAKLEMRNPCGSIKDRVGVALTEYAERRGVLHA